MTHNPTPGIKMLFPVKRKPTTSRAEFIAYWFAHHMPVTIDAMAGRGRGYIGTVFETNPESVARWDGIAQMFLDQPLQNPQHGFGWKPVDSFHERIEPYFGWATREYVVRSASKHLAVRPLTLSAPFPTSRSGFFKVVLLITTDVDTDHEALQTFWLNERAPQLAEALDRADGLGYVVSLSIDSNKAPYAGMEELYFRDEPAWEYFQELLGPAVMESWTTSSTLQSFFADTEFIGISS